MCADSKPANPLIAAWGVLGVAGFIINAIVRLTPVAVAPFERGMLQGWHLALIVVWTLASLYSEGYKGFQKAFAPRVVVRSLHLARHPRPLFVVAAPLFAMAFFHAKRSRLIFSYIFLSILVAVILIVQMVPQPWRGIIDVGVVAGLTYGVISMLVLFAYALTGRTIAASPDLPEKK